MRAEGIRVTGVVIGNREGAGSGPKCRGFEGDVNRAIVRTAGIRSQSWARSTLRIVAAIQSDGIEDKRVRGVIVGNQYSSSDAKMIRLSWREGELVCPYARTRASTDIDRWQGCLGEVEGIHQVSQI